MTGYAAKPLLEAVYTALAANGTLTGALSSDAINTVWITESASFPYCVIGEMRTSSYDDKTGEGSDTVFDVHVFSRDRDPYETHTLLGYVHNVLHRAELSVTGHTLVDMFQDGQTIVQRERTDNMTTFHGVMRFRALTKEV